MRQVIRRFLKHLDAEKNASGEDDTLARLSDGIERGRHEDFQFS